MLLSKVLENIPYEKVVGNTDIDIEDIYYNSRQVTANSLFFCIKGFNVDGHSFAEDAVKRGARALVVEQDVEVSEDIVKIFVEDSRLAMSHMAANFFGKPADSMNTIGITGTNGKTSIAYLLKSVLEEAGQKVGLIGTITNMIGNRVLKGETTTPTTPESLDIQRLFRHMVDEQVDTVVMEVTSHSLSLGRVEGIEFDVGVFTNLSQEHLDFHKTFEDYRVAKTQLFTNSKTSVINIDDESGRLISKEIKGDALAYGISNRDCKIYARDIDITPVGATFKLHLPREESRVDLSIPGLFSIYNSLAAAAAAHVLKIDLNDIRVGLESIYGVPGRFERLNTNTDFTIIIDYAHTPDGLENVLKTAKEMEPARLITLFGCGGDRDKSKRSVMGKVAGTYSDLCIITSDNPRTEDPMSIIYDIIPGILETKCEYIAIEDRKEAIEYAILKAKSADILILTGKGHETYQILKDDTIDFDERKIVAKLLGEGGI